MIHKKIEALKSQMCRTLDIKTMPPKLDEQIDWKDLVERIDKRTCNLLDVFNVIKHKAYNLPSEDRVKVYQECRALAPPKS